MSFICSLGGRDKLVLRASVRDEWQRDEADDSVCIPYVIACDLHLFFLASCCFCVSFDYSLRDACVVSIDEGRR